MTELKNSSDFDKIIKENKIVIVDFFADWCGPCKMLAPVLESISDKHSDVTFIKINVDEFADLAARYNVSSIPTILKFNETKLETRAVGYRDEETYTNLLGL